jgi:hypothetical protein
MQINLSGNSSKNTSMTKNGSHFSTFVQGGTVTLVSSDLSDIKCYANFLFEAKLQIGKNYSKVTPLDFCCDNLGFSEVFHSRDFLFPISRDPDDCFIPAFPGNRSGIPGNMIY